MVRVRVRVRVRVQGDGGRGRVTLQLTRTIEVGRLVCDAAPSSSWEI